MKNIFENIKGLSEHYRDYTASNLSKLIKIKSLSLGEKEVQQEVVRQMKEAGADDVFIDGLGNVIGSLGNGDRILAIDGHVDTVDVGNLGNWDFDPFSGEVKDGFVHGRGTVDQEGGIASMITSIRILKELGFDRNLKIYFVSSVIEEDCDGLCWNYIIKEDKIVPDFVIITEPTNLNIYRGHRGRMEIQISFNGISSHGSAPERGKNAIYMASRAALEIEKLNERLSSDEFLGKGSITISEMRTDSPSLCAVADYARLHIDRRLTWGETKESALAELRECIPDKDAIIEVPFYEEEAFTGNKYGMEKYYPTWKIPETDPVIKAGDEAFNSLYKKKPFIGKWTFSTNGVTINGVHGVPVIGFGPGNEVMAHAPNEKTPVEDLVVASAFYAAYAYVV